MPAGETAATRRLKARALLTAAPGAGAGPVFTTRTSVTLVRSH